MQTRLSSKQYVKDARFTKRPRCPKCLSDEIEGGPVDIDKIYARQTVTCQNCIASWVDVYRLHHYHNFQEA